MRLQRKLTEIKEKQVYIRFLDCFSKVTVSDRVALYHLRLLRFTVIFICILVALVLRLIKMLSGMSESAKDIRDRKYDFALKKEKQRFVMIL